MGTVEINVYQRKLDYPDEFGYGHHFMLGTVKFVTFRLDWTEGLR